MADTYIWRNATSDVAVQKATISFWVKKTSSGTSQYCFYTGLTTNWSDYSFYMKFHTDDTIKIVGASGGSTLDYKTNAVFRDPTAWMHIVIKLDMTETGTDRVKLYINGVLETSYSVQTAMTGTEFYTGKTGYRQHIGYAPSEGTYSSLLLSHYQYIDGTALAPTEFGETDATSGIWKLKTACYGTPGTNGFCLKMEDRTNLDLDSSSNALTMTTSGTGTATYDNPSNNFCTANSLMHNLGGGGAFTFSQGNNTIYRSVSDWKSVGATMPISASKWYWETKVTGWGMIGIWATWNNTDSSSFGSLLTNGGTTGSGPQSFAYKSDGYKYQTGYSGTASYGSTWSSGDIIGTAVDLDNGKIYFSHNGTWQNSGVPTSGATGTGSAYDVPTGGVFDNYLPAWTVYGNTMNINFGNGYFGTTAITTNSGNGYADDAGIGKMNYDVPAGYYSICTKNIKAYGG